MKVILEDKVIVAALQIGDEFISTITELAQERNIQAASLSAIGALRDFELGYYYLDRKKYDRKKFEPAAFFDLVTRERVTFACMPPTMINMALNHPFPSLAAKLNWRSSAETMAETVS